jgi:enoyl-CoA hydratase
LLPDPLFGTVRVEFQEGVFMSPSAVRVEIRPDRVAVLTIDQSGRAANVLTPELWADLDAALASLESEPDVRGLVIASGKPGVFIAGADLKFFLNLPGPNDPSCRAYVEQGLAVLDRLERLPFPTCAAIDGAALGGGLEVALACDFRVCNPGMVVQLKLPETTLGLIPGWGGTQRLSRIIGLEATALALATGNDVRDEMDDDFDLIDTEASGVHLTECAAGAAFTGIAESVRRRRIKAEPAPERDRSGLDIQHMNWPSAVLDAFQVLTRGAALPLADAIHLETETFLRLAGSDESKRLIAEFFARRKKG